MFCKPCPLSLLTLQYEVLTGGLMSRLRGDDTPMSEFDLGFEEENQALSEIEITNIINYARSSFSSSTETISLPEVKNALLNCN